jgi:hypothetical protein
VVDKVVVLEGTVWLVLDWRDFGIFDSLCTEYLLVPIRFLKNCCYSHQARDRHGLLANPG